MFSKREINIISKKIFFFFIIFFFAKSGHSEINQNNKECNWDIKDKIPCLVINKSAPNTSFFSKKIYPVEIISKEKIEKYNLIDLKKVIEFVSGTSVFQSGPTGQQASLFLRGSNSNHTLVLLNGIPINDQSTTNGLYDFGQDFMSNISFIQVYRGPSGAQFGPDSIGGAINLVTSIDFNNKFKTYLSKDSNNLIGNYTKIIKDWQINLQGGLNKSNTASALKGGSDKDLTNKSLGINVSRWFGQNIKFRSNLLSRNTFAELDGHDLDSQEGYDSDNKMYALQTSLDYLTKNSNNFLTFHIHEYERNYNSPNSEFDQYSSDSNFIRGKHSKIFNKNFSYGFGFDYKFDNSTFTNRGSYNSFLKGNYDNLGIYMNSAFKLPKDMYSSFNLRSDENSVVGKNNSYQLSLLKENFLPKINLRINHSKGFKNPSLYELYGADNYGYNGNINLRSEKSKNDELNFDLNISKNSKFGFSLFENETSNLIEYSNNTYVNSNGSLKQSGIEGYYKLRNKKNELGLYLTNLSSKNKNGSSQLRRPVWSSGFNYDKKFKFTGEYFDTHNSNYSKIVMPETHILDLTLNKKYFGMNFGLNVKNFLNKHYEAPHGFSQNKRSFNFIIKNSY